MNNVKEKLTCFHCGDECPADDISIGEKVFCCTGCKTVYEILNERDLCTYYSLEKNPGSQPPDYFDKFDFLDDESIIRKLLSFRNESTAIVKFYIPSIHCSSCIWLLEKLYKLNEGVYSSEVNFPDKTVLIRYRPAKITLKQIAVLLASIGYEPLLQMDSLDRKKEHTQNKQLLYKLGIAGFCFGNIMLLSFPEYLSINATELFYRKFFAYLNFFLSLPVLFYSASDYFKSAFVSIREKVININLPLSIGIAVLFSRSCFEIFTSAGPGYFDSMTGLVFLLLIGKYVQQRTYTSLNFERDYKSYFPLSVIRKKTAEQESIPVSELLPGDRILIRNKEIIPADSILFSGKAYIDYGFITGESDLAELKEGNFIYAGGKQHGGSIEVEILKEVSQSYLTSLWNHPSFSRSRQKHFSDFTNLLSKHFTALIIIISVVTGLLWLPDWYKAMDVFTAVLIVACPCALALSVPFTYGNAMRIFGRNKFYLRNSLNIEDLAKSGAIVIDKTGTLTEIDNSAIKFQGNELSPLERSMIKTAAGNSVHPLSRRIACVFDEAPAIEISKFDEYDGKGIEAHFHGAFLKLGTLKFVCSDVTRESNTINRTNVHLSINNVYKGCFEFSNFYREGVLEEIKELQDHYDIYLLSGDNEGEKDYLMKYFKDESRLFFRQTPEDKLRFIKTLQDQGIRVLMIGDGLNDAGALAQSDFGISVTENTGNFSPACDAIMDSSSMNKTGNFLKFSKDSTKIIFLNFIISLLYNIAGLSFAVNGLLTPLIAAVLMPVSSITVVALAAAGTGLAARKRGLNCQ